jgi:hypothetical protein
VFEITIRMRVPMIKLHVARKGWYSFLDGWTSYLSVAAPLFALVWVALEALFESGFVPGVYAHQEAVLETEKIAKFNR